MSKIRKEREIKTDSFIPYFMCFFNQRDKKDLNFRMGVVKYKKFITEVHKKIFVDLILDSKEGFILPHKLGNITIRKQRLVDGMNLERRATQSRIHYNEHTFGCVYSFNWNKANYLGMRIREDSVQSWPKYNNLYLTYFKIYAMTINSHNRSLLNYQIVNNLLSKT